MKKIINIKMLLSMSLAALMAIQPIGTVISADAAVIYQPGVNPGVGPGAAKNNTPNQTSPDAGDYAATDGTAQGSMSIDRTVPAGCLDAFSFEAKDPIVTTKDKYSYEDMEKELNSLKSKYSSTMTMRSLGTTADGRKIYEATVGNINAGTHILITGSIHAREYITTMLVMRQLEYLLSASNNNAAFDKKNVKSWLNDACVHFVPMINPDGVAISQFGLAGIKTEALKKTVNEAYANDLALGRTSLEFEPYLTMWKANANGVNLNDNFNALTGSINLKTDKVSGDAYFGVPGSEAETKALQNLADSRHFKAVINYHATGSVIYWNYEGNRLVEHCRDLANNIKVLTGYSMLSTGEEGGSYKAYLGTRRQPVTAVTVEVGKSRAPVNFSEFPTIWAQNKFVPLYTMKWAKEKGK